MADITEGTTVTETTQVENNGGDHVSPNGDTANRRLAQGNAGNAAAVSTSAEGQTEKTFTQKELDDIVKQRIDREKKNMPSKEEMAAFRKWQDSQKTAEQLSDEKISAAEKAKAEAESRAAQLEAKVAAYSKGVKSEAVDDVIALAMAKVSDDVPIDKAIEAVIAKYPSFCGTVPDKPKITTGVSFGNGSGGQSHVSGVEAAFLKKNPGLEI